MKIVEGKQYILCNLDKGWYTDCRDLLPLKNQKVTVIEVDYENDDYRIKDKNGKTYYCEAINLKLISINRRIE